MVVPQQQVVGGNQMRVQRRMVSQGREAIGQHRPAQGIGKGRDRLTVGPISC